MVVESHYQQERVGVTSGMVTICGQVHEARVHHGQSPPVLPLWTSMSGETGIVSGSKNGHQVVA